MRISQSMRISGSDESEAGGIDGLLLNVERSGGAGWLVGWRTEAVAILDPHLCGKSGVLMSFRRAT